MKRFLTWIALVGFGTISAVAVARVVQTELRSTVSLNRAGFEAWLVEPWTEPPTPGQARRAAWMLEQDFHNGYEWTPFYRGLEAEAKLRFQARWSLLLEEMLLQRARQFATLPSMQQTGYLESQLASLSSWYALDDRGRHISGSALLAGRTLSFEADHKTNSADAKLLENFRKELGKYAADRAIRRLLPGMTGDNPAKRNE